MLKVTGWPRLRYVPAAGSTESKATLLAEASKTCAAGSLTVAGGVGLFAATTSAAAPPGCADTHVTENGLDESESFFVGATTLRRTQASFSDSCTCHTPGTICELVRWKVMTCAWLAFPLLNSK